MPPSANANSPFLFVTALCASFAADHSTVTWASAGHPPPWDLDHGVPPASVRHCPPLGIEPTLEGTSVTTDGTGGGVRSYRRPTRARTARGSIATTSSSRRPPDADRPAGRAAGDILAGLRAAAVPRRGAADRRPVHGRDPPRRRRGRSAAGRVGAEARVARDGHEARVGHVGRRAGAGSEAVALELLGAQDEHRHAALAPASAARAHAPRRRSSSQRESGTSR